MNARQLLLGALAGVFACSCSLPRPRAPTGPPWARDFEATIDRIGQTDPRSPALLNARLAYAQFLLSAAPIPCAERLELARQQLASIDASSKALLMFPDGLARAADFQYRLRLAHAACSSDAQRKDDLLAAVQAALRAVELYRNVFDYRSMVIMQYDAAIALHRLGENAAALAALQVALDMDREYGFQDDGRENYGLLLAWRGQPAGAAQIAGFRRDFPKRRASLKFGWHPSDARIALERYRESLDDGQIVASRAAATFERRIGADQGGGWSVSYAHRLARYEPGVWPSVQSATTTPFVFPAAPLPAVSFKLSAAGDFEGVTDSAGFSARLTARTEQLIRAGAPSGHGARGAMNEALETAPIVLSPGILEAETAENYQLETAMWIGATLEQGVWYEISAPLSLPGMQHLVVPHQIEFAFTRMVPCTVGAAAPTCVEIVMRASPDERALRQVIADVGLAAYTSSIEVRIVTDPATLLPYAREAWVSLYASRSRGRGDSLVQSEHIVSTTSYDAD